MRTVITIIRLVLTVALISFAGCKSIMETDSPLCQDSPREPRHLDLSVGVVDYPVCRSVLSNDFIDNGGNIIKSALLCLFDPREGHPIKDISTGKFLVATTDTPYFEWSMNIDPDITEAEIYVVANLDPNQKERIERVFSSYDTTKDDLDELFFRCPNYTALTNMERLGYGLPLAGVSAINLDNPPDRLNLKVKNLFAKYTVWFNLSDLGDVSRIENISAKVINANTEVPFFSEGYGQDKISKLMFIDYASDGELDNAAKGGRDNAMTFIVPENCQGQRSGARHWTSVYEDLYQHPVSGQRWDKLSFCTFIMFEIKCFDQAGNMSIRNYRLYLGEDDMKSDFNIRRNISRTVRLTIDPDDVSPLLRLTNGPYKAGPGDFVDIYYESIVGVPYMEMYVQGKDGTDAGCFLESDETINYIKLETGTELEEGDKILIEFFDSDMDGDLIGTATVDIVEDYGFSFSPVVLQNNDIYGFQEIELVSERTFSENEIAVITSRYKWETEWSEGNLSYVRKSPGRYSVTARFTTDNWIGRDFTLSVRGKNNDKTLATFEGYINVPVIATSGENGFDGGKPYYLVDLTGKTSNTVSAFLTDDDGTPLAVCDSFRFSDYISFEDTSLDGTDIGFEEGLSHGNTGSFRITCYGFGGLPGLVPSQDNYSFKGKSFPVTITLKSPEGRILTNKTILAKVKDPFIGYGGNSSGIHHARYLEGEIGYDDDLDPKQVRNDVTDNVHLIFDLGEKGIPWPSMAEVQPSLVPKSGYFGNGNSFVSVDKGAGRVSFERNLDCYGRIALEGTLGNIHSNETVTLTHVTFDLYRVFTLFAGFDVRETYAQMKDGHYQRIETFSSNQLSDQCKMGSFEPFIVHNLEKGHLGVLINGIGVSCANDTPVVPTVQFAQDVILTQTGYNGTLYPRKNHTYYEITGNSYKISYINPTFNDGWNNRPESHIINFRTIAGFNPPRYSFTPPEHEYTALGSTSYEIRYAGSSGNGISKRYLYWCEPAGKREEEIPHTSIRLFWEGREGKSSFTRHDPSRTDGMLLLNGWYDPRYRVRYRGSETAFNHYWGGMYDYGKNYFDLDDKVWFNEDPLFEHRERWTNFVGNNGFGYPYGDDYHGWYYGYFGFLSGTLTQREERRCTAEWY